MSQNKLSDLFSIWFSSIFLLESKIVLEFISNYYDAIIFFLFLHKNKTILVKIDAINVLVSFDLLNLFDKNYQRGQTFLQHEFLQISVLNESIWRRLVFQNLQFVSPVWFFKSSVVRLH